ncbi:MAG: aspartyl protease family protein [Ignavibacteria bacterium]|nr:aspartyl protease family protein [Ignavibacteria bacterium]
MQLRLSLIIIFSVFLAAASFAQNNIPVIKAYQTKVSIKDGDEPVTRYWNHLSPKAAPLIYNILKTNVSRNVTFYTDVDSISFDVSPGKSYDFKVLLNQKDTCDIKLTTEGNPYYKNCFDCKSDRDTIPFILSKSNEIILKGSINNSGIIDIIFDTGAGCNYVIGKEFIQKLALKITGLTEDESVTGLATEQTSFPNQFQIGSLQWNNQSITYIDDKGYTGGGVITGYNMFEDKVLSIDYDKNLLILSNELPADINGYSSVPMRQTTGGTYIELTIFSGKKEKKGWFLFDTGASFELSINSDFESANLLKDDMKKIGTGIIASTEKDHQNADIMLAPKIKIGGIEIPEVPLTIGGKNMFQLKYAGIIGISISKQLNTIVDYRNQKIYFKPNNMFGTTSKKKVNDGSKVGIFSAALIVISILFLRYFYKHKKKLNKANSTL